VTTLILRRLLELVPTLLGVTIVTFIIMRVIPGGDPVTLLLGPEATPEAIEIARQRWGFDKPYIVQYFMQMWNLVRGDLGTSIVSGRPVFTILMERLPRTAELALLAITIASLIGILAGVVSAVYRGKTIDNITRVFVFIFLAMPAFWLGLELILLVSRKLQWLPPAEAGDGWIWERFNHLILPALTLGVGTGAFLCRILRSSMLQVMHQDYIRTARAKGLRGPQIIFKHTLRNALIPFVTVAGLAMGALLGGSVVVEQVFNWPGIGQKLIQSIMERDYPVTTGCVIMMAVIFVLVNLFVDLLYGFIDPRIRGE
jgi:peptide/nickel transport system permease protein